MRRVLNRVYDTVDGNGDGVLSRDELEQMAREAGIPMDDYRRSIEALKAVISDNSTDDARRIIHMLNEVQPDLRIAMAALERERRLEFVSAIRLDADLGRVVTQTDCAIEVLGFIENPLTGMALKMAAGDSMQGGLDQLSETTRSRLNNLVKKVREGRQIIQQSNNIVNAARPTINWCDEPDRLLLRGHRETIQPPLARDAYQLILLREKLQYPTGKVQAPIRDTIVDDGMIIKTSHTVVQNRHFVANPSSRSYMSCAFREKLAKTWRVHVEMLATSSAKVNNGENAVGRLMRCGMQLASGQRVRMVDYVFTQILYDEMPEQPLSRLLLETLVNAFDAAPARNATVERDIDVFRGYELFDEGSPDALKHAMFYVETVMKAAECAVEAQGYSWFGGSQLANATLLSFIRSIGSE